MTEKQDSTRLGLALSGGGFRASFFHIGVLAQMAMNGLLRQVEVISMVSGGSIIGALYYLRLKKLLETTPDSAITDNDYQQLVATVETDFLQAVQRNIRMRTFGNPLKNIQMTMANYSRSDRIGELYDEYFYRPALGPDRKQPVELRELMIRPVGSAEFHPLKNNVARSAKVPILLINATTLNTGHNWRFEAARMGEPPRTDPASLEIDKNMRLCTPDSYSDVVKKHQDFNLGMAVAASACVPGLFNPMAISDLYTGGVRVQLVDGGVHDNQGIEGLVDLKCTHFVVSDACGQMTDEADPNTNLAAIAGRSNSILMDRVREESLFRLKQVYGPRVAFVHLNKGLPAEVVPFLGADNKPAPCPQAAGPSSLQSKPFGVALSVQKLLALIRTDLDSFTDVEAFALMYDGYRMSQLEFGEQSGIRQLVTNATAPQAAGGGWRFLAIGPWMEKPTPKFEKHLAVASQTLLKVFRLRLDVAVITAAIVLTLLGALIYFARQEIAGILSSTFTVRQMLVAALIVGLGFISKLSRIIKVLGVLRRPVDAVVRLVTRGVLPTLGSIFVTLHLWIFDPIFINEGKIERLGPSPK